MAAIAQDDLPAPPESPVAVAALPEGSWASSPAVRRSMQGNRSRDTSPELALRRELHRRGLRFRVNVPVPGMPRRTIDIAWKGRKIAVFVDGCFWHGCPEHAQAPRAHGDYWGPKIARNCARDAETTRALADAGWLVLRVWEHEQTDCAADLIQRAVVCGRLTRSLSL